MSKSKNGCPWDRQQTHNSLLPLLIEESSEFIESVLEGNEENMCSELGDVLTASNLPFSDSFRQ